MGSSHGGIKEVNSADRIDQSGAFRFEIQSGELNFHRGGFGKTKCAEWEINSERRNSQNTAGAREIEIGVIENTVRS